MNTEMIEDIAEKLETNKKLFDDDGPSGVEMQKEEEEEEMKKSYVGEQLDDSLKSKPNKWEPG